MTSDSMFRLAIIGAGPVGLEVAAAASSRGYSTVVLERGDLGQHVLDWGHVQLFTPFGMNAGTEGLRVLGEHGVVLPDDEDFLTGAEFHARFLVPLGEAVGRLVTVETATTVISVSRNHLLKGEAIGESERARDCFRILCETEGVEHVYEAEIVFDCSGTYGNPSWLGPGGGAALGERRFRSEIAYGLPDILGADRHSYAGKHTLVVGDGYSAATSVLSLARLAEQHPDSTFHWATRGKMPYPVAPLSDDPLPARDDITRRANALAVDPPPGCLWECDVEVVSIERPQPDGPFTVGLRNGTRVHTRSFDRIIANVGFEPDDSLYRQLQIHECYASRGPIKVSAALMAASGDGPADCLSLGGFGPEVLINPEPNYFILGMKSYGKNSAFLLRTGYEQVADVFGMLNG
ncbi:MAG: hypothetical protein ACE5HT_11790 [Gemmatimonadales bacterium]